VKQKELDIVEVFSHTGEITVCFNSLDYKVKTFTFYFQVKNDDKLKSGVTIDHINEATNNLKKVQGLFDLISRNIYIKNDIDKELTESKF
jgi:hypothetical protein